MSIALYFGRTYPIKLKLLPAPTELKISFIENIENEPVSWYLGLKSWDLIESIPYFRYLMMGIGLLLIMRYRPKGILPEKIKHI